MSENKTGRSRLADKKREREKHLQGAFDLNAAEKQVVAPLTTKSDSSITDTKPLRLKSTSVEVIDDLFYRKRMAGKMRYKYEAIEEIIAKYKAYEELAKVCGNELNLHELVEKYADEYKALKATGQK